MQKSFSLPNCHATDWLESFIVCSSSEESKIFRRFCVVVVVEKHRVTPSCVILHLNCNMIMKDLKHDADVAGGDKEIVYSYDGDELPPLTFPVRATPLDELDESPRLPPEEAFQIFANKLYASNPYSGSQRVAANDTTSSESPLVRLSRLQRELQELEMDCSTKDEAMLFQDPIAALRQKLQALSTSQARKQLGLSASIQAAVHGLTEPVPATQVPAGPAVDVTSLEERLNRLEKSLGSNGMITIKGGNTSLLHRLEALEDQFAKLDEKKLDLLQKRSKVIRQDLEAAVKARHKLSSGAASSDDSKVIAALYDDLQRLQGLSQHLPALTVRLQALAHQHADSATRMARFKALEQMTADLSTQVQSIEVALTSLDISIQQNATLIHGNIQSLEGRLNSLCN
jgi:Dynamitin